MSEPSAEGSAQKPTKALPTDRTSFDKQLGVLRAYGAIAAEQGATAAAISQVVGLHSSSVSVCNPFFAENGFLERVPDGGYKASLDVIAYHRAAEWDPISAPEKLAPTMRGAWFWKALGQRLSFRPLDESEAIRVLTEDSAAGPAYRPQIKTILDYLDVAKLIVREGSQIRKGPQASSDNISQSTPPPSTQVQEEKKQPRDQGRVTTEVPSNAYVPGIAFDVSIRVNMQEMAGWSKKRIEAFFKGLADVLAAKGQAGASIGGTLTVTDNVCITSGSGQSIVVRDACTVNPTKTITRGRRNGGR